MSNRKHQSQSEAAAKNDGLDPKDGGVLDPEVPTEYTGGRQVSEAGTEGIDGHVTGGVNNERGAPPSPDDFGEDGKRDEESPVSESRGVGPYSSGGDTSVNEATHLNEGPENTVGRPDPEAY